MNKDATSGLVFKSRFPLSDLADIFYDTDNGNVYLLSRAGIFIL